MYSYFLDRAQNNNTINTTHKERGSMPSLSKLKDILNNESLMHERILNLQKRHEDLINKRIAEHKKGNHEQYTYPGEDPVKKGYSVARQVYALLGDIADLSKLPLGHGMGHLLRENVFLEQIKDDVSFRGLSPESRYYTTVAAMVHDIGRMVQPPHKEKDALIRHAEMGAIVFEEIAKELNLPEDDVTAIAFAIAAHTNIKHDRTYTGKDGLQRTIAPYKDYGTQQDYNGNAYDVPIQYIQFTRAIDRADMIGPTLVPRHFLSLLNPGVDYKKSGYKDKDFEEALNPSSEKSCKALFEKYWRSVTEKDSPYIKDDFGIIIVKRNEHSSQLRKILDAFDKKEPISQRRKEEILDTWFTFLSNTIEPLHDQNNEINTLRELFINLPVHIQEAWLPVMETTMLEYDQWTREAGLKDLSKYSESVVQNTISVLGAKIGRNYIKSDESLLVAKEVEQYYHTMMHKASYSSTEIDPSDTFIHMIGENSECEVRIIKNKHTGGNIILFPKATNELLVLFKNQVPEKNSSEYFKIFKDAQTKTPGYVGFECSDIDASMIKIGVTPLKEVAIRAKNFYEADSVENVHRVFEKKDEIIQFTPNELTTSHAIKTSFEKIQLNEHVEYNSIFYYKTEPWLQFGYCSEPDGKQILKNLVTQEVVPHDRLIGNSKDIPKAREAIIRYTNALTVEKATAIKNQYEAMATKPISIQKQGESIGYDSILIKRFEKMLHDAIQTDDVSEKKLTELKVAWEKASLSGLLYENKNKRIAEKNATEINNQMGSIIAVLENGDIVTETTLLNQSFEKTQKHILYPANFDFNITEGNDIKNKIKKVIGIARDINTEKSNNTADYASLTHALKSLEIIYAKEYNFEASKIPMDILNTIQVPNGIKNKNNKNVLESFSKESKKDNPRHIDLWGNVGITDTKKTPSGYLSIDTKKHPNITDIPFIATSPNPAGLLNHQTFSTPTVIDVVLPVIAGAEFVTNAAKEDISISALVTIGEKEIVVDAALLEKALKTLSGLGYSSVRLGINESLSSVILRPDTPTFDATFCLIAAKAWGMKENNILLKKDPDYKDAVIEKYKLQSLIEPNGYYYEKNPALTNRSHWPELIDRCFEAIQSDMGSDKEKIKKIHTQLFEKFAEEYSIVEGLARVKYNIVDADTILKERRKNIISTFYTEIDHANKETLPDEKLNDVIKDVEREIKGRIYFSNGELMQIFEASCKKNTAGDIFEETARMLVENAKKTILPLLEKVEAETMSRELLSQFQKGIGRSNSINTITGCSHKEVIVEKIKKIIKETDIVPSAQKNTTDSIKEMSDKISIEADEALKKSGATFEKLARFENVLLKGGESLLTELAIVATQNEMPKKSYKSSSELFQDYFDHTMNIIVKNKDRDLSKNIESKTITAPSDLDFTQTEVHRNIRVPLSLILPENRGGQKLTNLHNNVSEGMGTRTEGAILLTYTNGNTGFQISDGFHRVAEALQKGEVSIIADCILDQRSKNIEPKKHETQPVASEEKQKDTTTKPLEFDFGD